MKKLTSYTFTKNNKEIQVLQESWSHFILLANKKKYPHRNATLWTQKCIINKKY